jgi:DNA-binding transcriptional MerR regulator
MLGDNEYQYKIEELAREAEAVLRSKGIKGNLLSNRVSEVPDNRTIRYYTTLGLIDRPVVKGRLGFYGKRHLLQLVVIKALQTRGLSLSDIQKNVYGRTDEELEAILYEVESKPAPRPIPDIDSLATSWREITIYPGIRLSIQDGAEKVFDSEGLAEKIVSLLEALKSKQGNSERR